MDTEIYSRKRRLCGRLYFIPGYPTSQTELIRECPKHCVAWKNAQRNGNVNGAMGEKKLSATTWNIPYSFRDESRSDVKLHGDSADIISTAIACPQARKSPHSALSWGTWTMYTRT